MTDERPYITCRELLGFLDVYLDGELAPERRYEFDRHLAVCPPCRNYIEQYRLTIRAAKSAYAADPDAPAPEDVPAELIALILRSRG